MGGVTLVVSPLIALMTDQVSALTAKGIRAVALSSALSASDRRCVGKHRRVARRHLNVVRRCSSGRLWRSSMKLEIVVAPCCSTSLQARGELCDEADLGAHSHVGAAHRDACFPELQRHAPTTGRRETTVSARCWYDDCRGLAALGFFPVLTLVCSQMKHIASAGEPRRVLCAVVAAHREVRTVPWSQLGPRLSTELPKAKICARLVAARTMCSADGDCHQGQCPFVQWCGPWRPPGLTHPQPIHRSVFKPTFCVNCVCRPRTCFAPRSTGPT